MASKKDALRDELEAIELDKEDMPVTEVDLTDVSEDIVEEPIKKGKRGKTSEPVEAEDELFLHLPFVERINKQRVVKETYSDVFSEKYGKVYAFSLNGVTFAIRFDGGETELPLEVHTYFGKKLLAMTNATRRVEILTDSL